MARGRPSLKFTDHQRKEVEAMAGYGVPHEDISKLLECDPKSLRKHFRRELDQGTIRANAKVSQTLFQQATGGNIAAAIFWLKARANWREVPQQDKGVDANVTITINGGLPD